MANINDIDYGDLIFSKRHEIDKKAYSKYYNDNFNSKLEVDFDDYGGFIVEPVSTLLSYNAWYDSPLHKKYVLPLLRKMKLEKIKKS